MQHLDQSRFRLIMGMILVIAVVVSYFYKRSSVPPAVLEIRRDVILITEPFVMELGRIVKGGKMNGTFMLKNLTNADVEVSQIETSCDCLHLQAIGTIASQETKSVSLAVDFAKVPDFVGGLTIEVEGKTKTGQSAFKLLCRIDVASR